MQAKKVNFLNLCNFILTALMLSTFSGCSPSILSLTPTSLELNLSADSVANDGLTPITVSLQLKDAEGNPTPGQIATLVSSRGSVDTVTGSGLSDSLGLVTFNVTSATLGSAQLTASIPLDALVDPVSVPVLFLSATPWTDFQAQLASGLLPGNNNFASNPWNNLNANSGSTLNGKLNLFSFSSLSGWSGNGSVANPYALTFNGTGSNAYVDFGTGLNNPSSHQFSFEAWLAPASVSTANSVILGNGTTGTTANSGMTLKQSAVNAGSTQLTLGDRSYQEEILNNSPTGYWRLNEGTGTGVDFTGNSPSIIYTNTSAQPTGSLAMYPNASTVFNGTNSSAQIPANSNLNIGAGDFTFIFNAYIVSGGGTKYLFVWNDPTYAQFQIYMQGTALTLQINDPYGGPVISYDPGNNTFLDSWHQFTFSLQSSQIEVFVDNIQVVGSNPLFYFDGTNLVNTGTPVYFGSNAGSTTNVLNGAIDNISFFRHGVIPSEISYLTKLKSRPTCISTVPFIDGIWHFFSSTFDGTNLTFAVDGTQQCTVAGTGTFNSSTKPLRIGADSTGAHPWSGEVADFRTYQTALTPTQINLNYTATQNRF